MGHKLAVRVPGLRPSKLGDPGMTTLRKPVKYINHSTTRSVLAQRQRPHPCSKSGALRSLNGLHSPRDPLHQI